MAIVFYSSPMTNATRVHWALEELAIPYEKVTVDLKAGDQKKPGFLKVNPNGKVPALVDDGAPLFESLAILLHLGARYGVDKGLWPAATSADHAHALSWTVWSTTTLAPIGFRLLQNTSNFFPADLHNAGQAEVARKDLDGLLGLLEAQLTGKPFLLGEAFSLVDVANAATIWWLQGAMGLDVSRWPNVGAWVKRSTERPAMAKVLAG